MTTDTRTRRSALGLAALYPFWEQLRESLFLCVPERALAFFRPVVARVVLEPSGESIVAWRQDPTGRHRLGELRGSPADRARIVGGENEPIVLRLPADRTLVKELSLPLEAEPDLRRVVAYQMARETPFTAQQVYFDAVVIARDAERKRLRAKLVVAPRPAVDPLIEQIARSGIQPGAIEAGGVSGSNLLPPEQRPRPRRSVGRLNKILGAVAGLLLVGAIVVPLVEKHLTVEGLKTMLADAQRRSGAVVKLREELDDIHKALGYFSGRQATGSQLLLMMDELAKALPDGTWLQLVEVTGNQLRITGESKDAAALIGLVEGSPLFAEVSFQAPVTRNPTTGSERFTIGARIESIAGAPEQ